MALNINMNYESLWPIIAGKTLPPGLKPNIGVLSDPTSWIYAIKRDAMERTVHYTGGCGASVPTGGIQASSMIAQAGQAIPIIGGAVSGIASTIANIFAHHAHAVANEQQAECAVNQICSDAIPRIDDAVANGQITANQGIAMHSQIVAKCKAILAPVSGVGNASHPCNAGCVFGLALDGLQYFAEVYYMDLSPQGGAATAPQTYSPASPASFGSALVDSIFPPSGSPGVQTSFPWGLALFAVAALAIVIYFVKD